MGLKYNVSGTKTGRHSSQNLHCPECDTICYYFREKLTPVNKLLRAKTYKIPFYCTTCGAIKWELTALRDVIFLYPFEPAKTFRKDGLLSIPEQYRQEYRYMSDFGVVLSVGPGYYGKKRFYPTDDRVKPGMVVAYDKYVLWETLVKGTDGINYVVKMMGFGDMKMHEVLNA